MTVEEEEYLHAVVSADVLNRARTTLLQIQGSETDNILTAPAFQFALVQYCQPFKTSRGAQSQGRRAGRYRLDEAVVPGKWRDLHEQIVAWRDSYFAHSDLAKLDVRVWVTKIGGRKYPGRVQNHLTGLELLPCLGEIVALIEALLDDVYSLIAVLGN